MYASLGRRLFEAPSQHAALEILLELKEKLRQRVPVLEEVKALFPQIIYTENFTKQRHLVKYILTGFDKAASKGNITVDYNHMTIEHLVPQSAIGTGDYTDTIVGQLGNLILVSDKLNQKLRDKPFKEKKRILQAAKYSLPKEVADADDWKVDDIAKQTLALAEKAYNSVWKI